MIILRRISCAVTALWLLFSIQLANAQTPSERHQKIRAATDAGDRKRALSELRNLQEADAKLFAANNYDYLQARLAETTGEQSQANASYNSVVAR
jgi:hypothetical protein